MGYGNNYYNCSYFNSIFIATSPHVIACGATTKNSNKGESAFRISGGGFSDKFSRPSYQGDAVDRYFYLFIYLLLFYYYYYYFIILFYFFYMTICLDFHNIPTPKNSYFNQGKGIPSTSFFNKHGRGFPDVGVVGQDYLVYIGGDLETISGTSASTPAMAAMISMFFFCFFVLFCFVLFCFVLFCFVLFCFVLFCFVLFCFVLFLFVFIYLFIYLFIYFF